VIVTFLKWVLSKFESKPTLKEQLTAWPFPDPSKDFFGEPRPIEKKAKPRVAKATTRKPAAKKATTVAKKATPKKAK
jgi:hypothetical protein